MNKMEPKSKIDLLAIIDNQKETIEKYKIRLKDLIAAYKGMIIEKEALEASLNALQEHKVGDSAQPDSGDKNSSMHAEDDSAVAKIIEQVIAKQENSCAQDGDDDLHKQITTLMNSLSTLSVEKSRMEACFQADRKRLKAEKEQCEKIIKELESNLTYMQKQHKTEIDNLKCKFIVERHEREKEQNDHGIMIRELQKVVSEERKAKDGLEKEIEELKSKVLEFQSHSLHHEEYEKRLLNMTNELELTKQKLKKAETISKETLPYLMEELQEEMSNMKIQHQRAILKERQQAAEAEEKIRVAGALHEQRVANLESRLAELSEIVGEYSRNRQHDQEAISKLKDYIAKLDNQPTEETDYSNDTKTKENIEIDTQLDLQTLKSRIQILFAKFIKANSMSEKPFELSEILNIADPAVLTSTHSKCREEYLQLQKEFENFKQQILIRQNKFRSEEDTAEIAALKSQIRTFQEKVKILISQLEDSETNYKLHVEESNMLLKLERAKFREEKTTTETEFRGQILLCEQQLQKQRERSLLLLEEKDQEISTLKSSFQIFLPGNKRKTSYTKEEITSDVADGILQFDNIGQSLKGGENPHMLHYAHELARKDVEISNLRKIKLQLESNIRELQRKQANEVQAHSEKVSELQNEIERLKRCQTREGANLEYLKNVIMSYLMTSDANSKRHMLNAIAAVLKFSESEIDQVLHN